MSKLQDLILKVIISGVNLKRKYRSWYLVLKFWRGLAQFSGIKLWLQYIAQLTCFAIDIKFCEDLAVDGKMLKQFAVKNCNTQSTNINRFFIFSPKWWPFKNYKCFLLHPKSSFCSRGIQILIFSVPFHSSMIQKDKW